GGAAMDAPGRVDRRLVERLREHLQATSTLPVKLVETHISWLLLGDTTAYKIKKPVRLPFLDFSTLHARRHFCEEELRLNRRQAGALYLGITRITGSVDAPALDGAGPAIEYAVRMQRFADGSLLADHARAGTLAARDIDRLAERLAALHDAAPVAGADSGYGSPARRRSAALAALDGAAALAPPRYRAELDALRRWLAAEADRLEPRWRARVAAGRVREGHGDLHLANVVLLDDEPVPFDAIEFDPALRWIDVVDDAAFVVMDLFAHERRDLGWRFLDAWLAHAGDHAALPLLRHAIVYRALVRAQVGLLRERQGATPEGPGPAAYLDVALHVAQAAADARLAIAHGLPGAGKSQVARQLLERAGALRLRSDVERKRLFGLAALDDSGGAIYAADATERTYARLAALAREALAAGLRVIVDAAFLRRAERDAFAALARECGVPFAILDCRAPLALLRERVAARHARRDDASEADLAVLERLAVAAEPLAADEQAAALAVDTSRPVDIDALAHAWLARSA
ncbi:MAG TPA: AAA family ATPase, partial [Burkholderiaceae bacterium]